MTFLGLSFLLDPPALERVTRAGWRFPRYISDTLQLSNNENNDTSALSSTQIGWDRPDGLPGSSGKDDHEGLSFTRNATSSRPRRPARARQTDQADIPFHSVEVRNWASKTRTIFTWPA